jgi:outer membrane protein
MIYLAFFSFVASMSFAATTLTDKKLNDLIDKNPDVQSMLKRLESSEALKGRLTRSFLPTVSLSYGREKFTTGPYHSLNQPFGGVEAEINIFNSGKDKIESTIRDNQAEIAKIDATLVRSQVLAELKKAMSHYAYLLEIKTITNNAMTLNEENLKSAKKRINAGLASETDSLDFRQQKIQFAQEISTLDYELGVTQRLISTLLGNDPNDGLMAQFSNEHPDHSDESKLNFTGKSLIVKKAELNKEATYLEYRKDKRWWAPRLDLYGYALRFTQKEREYTPSDERNDVTFGFKFSLPIFDGGEGYTGTQATKALVQARRSEVRSQELVLQRQSLDALKKLELAHALIHGAEENVQIMNAYRKGVLSEYSKGVKNSPDVLQASQRWIEANIRNAEVKKNYQFAKVEAEYLSSLQGGY